MSKDLVLFGIAFCEEFLNQFLSNMLFRKHIIIFMLILFFIMIGTHKAWGNKIDFLFIVKCFLMAPYMTISMVWVILSHGLSIFATLFPVYPLIVIYGVLVLIRFTKKKGFDL